jgi:opacity protein-like surface antigen
LGDINHSKQFYSPKIGYGVLYRHNINSRYAARIFLNKLTVSGSDLDFSNGYQQIRAHSFSQSIIEFGAMAEFNFLDFIPLDYQNFSPYLTAGPSLAYTQIPGKNFQFVFPFGAGVKYAPNKRLTIGLEWVFRKTFTDRIDLLYNNTLTETTPLVSDKQLSNDNTKDWYSFAGIVLSYNFASEKKWCPAYKKPNK